MWCLNLVVAVTLFTSWLTTSSVKGAASNVKGAAVNNINSATANSATAIRNSATADKFNDLVPEVGSFPRGVDRNLVSDHEFDSELCLGPDIRDKGDLSKAVAVLHTARNSTSSVLSKKGLAGKGCLGKSNRNIRKGVQTFHISENGVTDMGFRTDSEDDDDVSMDLGQDTYTQDSVLVPAAAMTNEVAVLVPAQVERTSATTSQSFSTMHHDSSRMQRLKKDSGLAKGRGPGCLHTPLPIGGASCDANSLVVERSPTSMGWQDLHDELDLEEKGYDPLGLGSLDTSCGVSMDTLLEAFSRGDSSVIASKEVSPSHSSLGSRKPKGYNLRKPKPFSMGKR